MLGCTDCLACYCVLLGGENALAAPGPNCGSALVLDVAGVVSSQGQSCLSWPAGNVRRGLVWHPHAPFIAFHFEKQVYEQWDCFLKRTLYRDARLNPSE